MDKTEKKPRFAVLSQSFFEHVKDNSSDYWLEEGRAKTLALFHDAAERVPAYKAFLKSKKIDPTKIRTYEDFKKVPAVNKQNYLKAYPFEKLCWDGTLAKPLVFTSTSGSTGAPFYFPRSEELDVQYSYFIESFLTCNIQRDKPVLVIICFGMGVWIGGLITYQAFEIASRRGGYPVSIITPGVNKKEIFETLKNIGDKFDQIILCGYPPFIKDIIDGGKENEINWKDHNMRFIFAAETFSEQFRTYIMDKTGTKNPCLNTMNIYGSADLGAMATETPLSIAIRQIALTNKEVFKKLFGDIHRVPTLAQFNPGFVHFETDGKQLYCNADNALPLVRYEIGDSGGVHSFNEIKTIFREAGLDLYKEAERLKISDFLTELPFVYIYERVDLSTKLYGATIFPEHIREVLQDDGLEKNVTGKFTMLTKFTRSYNQYLEINIELKPESKVPLFFKRKVKKLIIKKLIERNAEYKNNFSMMGKKVEPKIIFWPQEHPLHFKTGIKQKWVKK